MADLTAKRTLVKSPPELWEELSEIERLAKHLGAFGEITITKLEPERTVAWEGEHASGTVSIEASGWGTKVTLTAELPEPEEGEPGPERDALEEHAVVEPPVAEGGAAAEDAVTEEPASREPAPEKPASQERVAEGPAAAEPLPAARQRGFWARLFGRNRERKPVAAGEPVLVPETPGPERHAFATLGPATPAGAARPPATDPRQEPEPDPAPAAGVPEDHARAVLDEVLDTLGAAHHRPFSRP